MQDSGMDLTSSGSSDSSTVTECSFVASNELMVNCVCVTWTEFARIGAGMALWMKVIRCFIVTMLVS